MNMRGCLLGAYSALLHLYPSSFRKRFAAEMLDLAEMAEPGEWPLIFADTSVAVVRCWVAPSATASTMPQAGPDAYLAIGTSAISASRLLQGMALSVALVLSLCYAGSLGYLDLPKCHAIAAENISR